MRLIDADAFMKLIADARKDVSGWYVDADGIVEAVIEELDEQPTVEAVEVVHCRDCRWYGTNFPGTIPAACHRSDGLLCVEEYEYCSRGERRTDG